ncbi:MAG: hypothetical protein WDO13_20250 [Verrucomicrobiota bacterium]
MGLVELEQALAHLLRVLAVGTEDEGLAQHSALRQVQETIQETIGPVAAGAGKGPAHNTGANSRRGNGIHAPST